MKFFAIFDLDGTLADDRDRRYLINKDDKDPVQRYVLYHESMEADTIINIGLVVEQNNFGHEIVFATSRPDRYFQRTINWLHKHFSWLPRITLLMREEGDFRPSPEVKLTMVQSVAKKGNIAIVYDDRQDVCLILQNAGFNTKLVVSCGEAPDETHLDITPDAILRQMADTFVERSSIYGDNLLMVQPIAEILFPDGVPTFNTKMHLFELLLMKLTRFAVSDLTHTDSIHDIGVYAAMLESHISKEK